MIARVEMTAPALVYAMRCDCSGYYTCNSCPTDIADRANDAAEVLRAALPIADEITKERS